MNPYRCEQQFRLAPGLQKIATIRILLLTTSRRCTRNRLPCSSRGVFRRRSIGGARCGCPATAARNRRLTREARGTARQALRPGCEELAARVAEDNSADGSAAPGPKSPRRSAERRASRVMGRKALRSAPSLPRQKRSRASDAAGPTGAAAPVRLSALRPPLMVGIQFHAPGANAPRECDRLFEIVRCECTVRPSAV